MSRDLSCTRSRSRRAPDLTGPPSPVACPSGCAAASVLTSKCGACARVFAQWVISSGCSGVKIRSPGLACALIVLLSQPCLQTYVEQTSLTLSVTLILSIEVAALYVAHSRKVHILCHRHLQRLRCIGGVAGAPTTCFEGGAPRHDRW